MRLSKHTPEEIEIAKKESGDATPTEEQLEEWKLIHNKLNKDHALSVESQIGCRIVNLDNVVWPMLGSYGKSVAHGKGSSTVMEILKNKKTGHHFPWCKSGLLGYEHITEEALEGIDCERVVVLCQFLNKVIEVEKGNIEQIEYWIKRFAALFNQLAYYGKIKYGILSTFMAMPLADIEAERQVMEYAKSFPTTDGLSEKLDQIRQEVMNKSKTMRVMLAVYPYTHFELEELNEWLGNPAFVPEGDLGTTDWSGLPDV